jgi:S-adenosylmethionine hydrolase
LTLVAEDLGIAEVRQIDENANRLPGSERSYTFHGRDIYAFIGARLAAGVIPFEQVGPRLEPNVVRISYEKARSENGALWGSIPILDVQYGNVWTNIDADTFKKFGVEYGALVSVQIKNGERIVYAGKIPFARTFGEVPVGQPLLYINSLLNVSFAINQGSFAKLHNISSGPAWQVVIEK